MWKAPWSAEVRGGKTQLSRCTPKRFGSIEHDAPTLVHGEHAVALTIAVLPVLQLSAPFSMGILSGWMGTFSILRRCSIFALLHQVVFFQPESHVGFAHRPGRGGSLNTAWHRSLGGVRRPPEKGSAIRRILGRFHRMQGLARPSASTRPTSIHHHLLFSHPDRPLPPLVYRHIEWRSCHHHPFPLQFLRALQRRHEGTGMGRTSRAVSRS
mmetsp:Transcript_125307/g.217200  ORF Transcript_125307/g.217200 Transcript_125307/m.217200 type:complete len:211 (-) Transcript_125307:370-1002(-)